MIRKIIHLDLDAFFCAVEELRDPSLMGKAFVVGGRPESRGVVSSCSYAARRFGIHSAMPMSQALRLCPDLIIIPPRHHVYSEVSDQVMERLRSITPLVEQISIDEAFLDVSDLPEPGDLIARHLQKRIRDELGLPCSLGIATNKLLAKTATDAGKAAARGTLAGLFAGGSCGILVGGAAAGEAMPVGDDRGIVGGGLFGRGAGGVVEGLVNRVSDDQQHRDDDRGFQRGHVRPP